MEVRVELRTKVAGVKPSTLASFADRARRAAGLRGGVSIVITSDAEMKRMNSWFRGKRKATDVLSFTATGIKGYLGDIAISSDIAAVNALRLRHSLEDELKVLIVHGLLHLGGHDHENDSGQMLSKEGELRHRLGLPMTLIQRGPAAARTKAVRPR